MIYGQVLEQSHQSVQNKKIKKKVANFTHFCSKTTHISLSKTLFICKIATITVHICAVTSFLYDYFMFFLSPLSSPLPCQTLSHPLFNAKKKKKRKPIITTNQPPPQPIHHNINLIQTQSTQN